ncbi:MAG TPA: hypothetical protein VJG32_04655 [Anaerolineae bacterium]|nr:hypothetical protein [Anaerolineae bacterium]
MDPLTTTVVSVLGKYAIDKGASLLKEAGQAAAAAAARLFQKVMERLKADPGEAKNAERFEKNPEAFKAPVEVALDEQVQADPDFAAQLKALLGEYEKAASVSIANTGSGAVATGGGVAAGAGGIAVGGNVSGGIIQGSGNTVTNRSGGTDINASGGSVNITGDVVGRDKKG